jgi:hypothetical protein
MVSPIGVGLNVTTAIVANEVVVGITADKAVFTNRGDVLNGFIASSQRVLGIRPEVVHF